MYMYIVTYHTFNFIYCTCTSNCVKPQFMYLETVNTIITTNPLSYKFLLNCHCYKHNETSLSKLRFDIQVHAIHIGQE